MAIGLLSLTLPPCSRNTRRRARRALARGGGHVLPEVVPPAPDLCPLWLVWRPGDRPRAQRGMTRLELCCFADRVETVARHVGDYGPGRYEFRSPGGELIARFVVRADDFTEEEEHGPLDAAGE